MFVSLFDQLANKSCHQQQQQQNLKDEVSSVKQQESKLQARYAQLLAEAQALRVALSSRSSNGTA